MSQALWLLFGLSAAVSAQEQAPRCPAGTVKLRIDYARKRLDCRQIGTIQLAELRQLSDDAIAELSAEDRRALSDREAALDPAPQNAEPASPPSADLDCLIFKTVTLAAQQCIVPTTAACSALCAAAAPAAGACVPVCTAIIGAACASHAHSGAARECRAQKTSPRSNQ